MTISYTQVTVSGYNSSPPPDDGSTGASNQVTWASIKTKLSDPLKTAIDSIDDNVAAAITSVATDVAAAIGTTVQPYDAELTAIAALATTDSNFIVGNGSTWVAESGSTARTSLGLGSLATASTINNDNWSGTDLAVANGGTGASTAGDARTNLGLGTAATQNTGTSGATLPFLNGNNVFSGTNQFSADQGFEAGNFDGNGAANGVIWSDRLASSRNGSSSLQQFAFHNTNGQIGSITTSGTTTAYNTSSDERLKTDFELAGEVGHLLDSVRIYSFTWKGDGLPGFGPKAQELYRTLPSAVTVGKGEPGDADFEPWTWDASKLVPYLLVEIQSLRKRVQELEQR